MKSSPLIEQYLSLKEENKDSILFFRLGDFYEMFLSDAEYVSSALGLTLTHRAGNPMCGIPYHAAGGYIKKLLDMGHKVAICEQVGMSTGTLMERKVVRLITPGTLTNEDFLDEGENSYIMSFYSFKGSYYLCKGDISLGRFVVRKLPDFESLLSYIRFNNVRELVVCDNDYFASKVQRKAIDSLGIIVNKLPSSSFTARFGETLFKDTLKVVTSSFSEIETLSPLWGAIGGLFDYFKTLNLLDVIHVTSLFEEKANTTLILDENAIKSLEVVTSSSDKSYYKSLFGVLNYTSTAMGRRTLKERLCAPLRDIKQIEERLDWCEFFVKNTEERGRVKKLLGGVYDIERMGVNLINGNVKKYHLTRLARTVDSVNSILANKWEEYKTIFKKISNERFNALVSFGQKINETIDDDITEKQLIKDGANAELDKLREFVKRGDGVLEDYLLRVKQETGITNLRISNSRIFGYTLDVTPSFVNKVPSSWVEKQTLVTCRRYITEELKNLEKEKTKCVFDAERLENAVYNAIVEEAKEIAEDVFNLSDGIKNLDFYISLAEAAYNNSYVRPHFSNSGEIIIKNGRHPIVERFYEKGRFVSNDIDINNSDKSFLLITGPNMAGKSTYLRQNALIIIMAQLGSFVSASDAVITPVDRIFSRLGFNDNIASGESTFLVEMRETALILRLATKDSFVILDEIGRGTGSDDGKAIAESVMRFMAKKRIKTLFATHYLNLAHTDLPNNIYPITLDVDDKGGTIRFLRRVVPGIASSSYGIHVAKLAGVPDSVIFSARKLLSKNDTISESDCLYTKDLFDESEEAMNTGDAYDEGENNYSDIISMIENFNIDSSTPMDALLFVKKIQDEIKECTP